MGKLAGFSYQDVTKKLSKLGFKLKRQGKGSHEIWSNKTKNLIDTRRPLLYPPGFLLWQ